MTRTPASGGAPRTPSELRALLARHRLAPSRERGQNFLADETLAARLAEDAGVTPGDDVIEIGTGLGILTHALVARGARVRSVEIDAGLVRVLREEALLPPEVELIHADALSLDLAALVAAARGPVRVVANLPYAVATPLLRRLLDLAQGLEDWSVLVQREVAERLAAGVGEPGYGSFAVLHAWCTRVERKRDVGPRCFHPVPRVSSRFVRIRPLPRGGVAAAELARLEPLLRAGFNQRRKQLVNALRGAAGLALAEPPEAALAALGLPAAVRAEALSPGDWLQLARRLADPEKSPVTPEPDRESDAP